MRLASLGWAALVSSGLLAIAPDAVAQEAPAPPVGANGRAVEIGVSGGFVDGWSNISLSSPDHVHAPGAGGQLEGDVGWRALPNLALGIYGFGAQLSEIPAVPSAVDFYAAGAGLQGTWHFRPRAWSFAPWASLGAGWRGQWLTYQTIDGGSIFQNGIDMLRVRAGLDMHASPSVALSPVVGVNLATFLNESVSGSPWGPVRTPNVNTFLFAGVRATVDVPVGRRPPTLTAITR